MEEKINNRIAFFGDSLTEGIPGISYLNLLKEKLPNKTLLNYGRGGDTIISLYRRIQKLRTEESYNIVFLWIGTNDIFVNVSAAYSKIKYLLRQPWARNDLEFEQYYQRILEKICTLANKVITVSPLFIGEDPSNIWNKKLRILSKLINELSNKRENVFYIDLHEEIRLDKQKNNYIARNAFRVLLDALFLRSKDQVDKKSSKRGLSYTLDGVHLNSKGAQIVADIFYKQIIMDKY